MAGSGVGVERHPMSPQLEEPGQEPQVDLGKGRLPKTNFLYCFLGSGQGEGSWCCFGHVLSMFVPCPSAGGNLPCEHRAWLTGLVSAPSPFPAELLLHCLGKELKW